MCHKLMCNNRNWTPVDGRDLLSSNNDMYWHRAHVWTSARAEAASNMYCDRGDYQDTFLHIDLQIFAVQCPMLQKCQKCQLLVWSPLIDLIISDQQSKASLTTPAPYSPQLRPCISIRIIIFQFPSIIIFQSPSRSKEQQSSMILGQDKTSWTLKVMPYDECSSQDEFVSIFRLISRGKACTLSNYNTNWNPLWRSKLRSKFFRLERAETSALLRGIRLDMQVNKWANESWWALQTYLIE